MCGVSSYGIFEQWNAKKRGSTVYYLPRCLRRGSGLCAGPDGRRAIYHVQRNAAGFFEGGGGLKRRDNNDREEPCFHTRPRRGGRVWAWSRPDKNAHFCFVCVRVCGGGGRRPTHARTHTRTNGGEPANAHGRARSCAHKHKDNIYKGRGQRGTCGSRGAPRQRALSRTRPSKRPGHTVKP